MGFTSFYPSYVLTDSTLDKLLQDGADMVIEKFKRTRGQGDSLSR
jgi:hypothetical protein